MTEPAFTEAQRRAILAELQEIADIYGYENLFQWYARFSSVEISRNIRERGEPRHDV